MLDIDYQMPGKIFRTKNKKLGRAKDFSFNRDTYQIMSVAGRPTARNAWKAMECVYYREQVESIDDK